ncbi:hypothetical protein [Actinomadura sp. 9N407]|uniref:hypothetical protein n=1 Tax=Actinomadura sp. 9N407 TaxID=3375154 RepID=UPI00378F0D5F
MDRKKINEFRDYLIGAAQDYPGAVEAGPVPGEHGMFSVDLGDGEELFVAIAAVTA